MAGVGEGEGADARRRNMSRGFLIGAGKAETKRTGETLVEGNTENEARKREGGK